MIDYPEGATPLDLDELAGLKFSHITTRGELDHLEQANIQNGLRWLARLKNRDILNDQFARKLHLQLFGEVWSWAGQYRLTEKNIGVDPLYISVKLRELLDNVQYWVDQDTFNPKETATRFHHQLVYIHPFPNGNGRHARFYADALLEKLYSVDRIDWSGGYDLQQMNERRQQYIHALRAADAGDYTSLFEFTGVDQ
ncbi:MAG: mobile mystery protein B [Gammaproteobacteria bacterium]|jgi:Fic-DOC domain mobile mystery protein B|nr:mobile mystery protein B [Gammaproteobacteria bacterium]MBT3725324.1 mobile mystery protein B [Gammaproteobacteria bacterium]MBT4076815.1 mobile mystery protein B [Gammaproteobacteria bacterium]MBT4195370.1 mobile mystery protein B [Gammaproteobacteria bacterium]MBT4449673.1 mobile mystery protein B [Gammaproteobacteria bacterium]